MHQPGEGQGHRAVEKTRTGKLLKMPWIALIALWLSGAAIMAYRYFADPPYAVDHYLAGIQLLVIGAMVLWIVLLLKRKSMRTMPDLLFVAGWALVLCGIAQSGISAIKADWIAAVSWLASGALGVPLLAWWWRRVQIKEPPSSNAGDP